MGNKLMSVFAVMFAVVFIGGCSTIPVQHLEEEDIAQYQMDEKEKELQILKLNLKEKEKELEQYRKELTTREGQLSAIQEKSDSSGSEMPLLPQQAVAGECYARVFIPPKYQVVSEKILQKEMSEKIEIIPPVYEDTEEKIMVKPAAIRLVEIPAEYQWIEEKIMVKPENITWKKGRGLIEKIDNTTGEIMCLVKDPAVYQTVKKHVLVKPATFEEIQEPPVYKTVNVKKLVKAAEQKRTPIPAEYETITKKQLVNDGHLEWKRVLCETNLSGDIIVKLQEALTKAGFSPGKIDGIMGWRTTNALKAFQEKHELATGGITYETVQKLGIIF
jgi:hypothetical protein